LFLTMILIGLTGGILTGLMSVGGGLILIFLLLFIPPFLGLEYTMHTIAGMVIISTIFSSSSGLVTYWRNRLVDPFLIRYMGLSSFAGGALGSLMAGTMSNQLLTVIFAALSLVATASMFLKPVAPDSLPYHNKKLAVLIGLGIGVLGGMFGLSAGFLYIPIMLNIFKIQPKPAVGTALALGIALVLGALIGKAGEPSFPWMEGLTLALGAIPGAQIGAYFSRKVNAKSLRYLMAVAIIIISVKIWVDMLRGYGVSTLSLWIGFLLFGMITAAIIFIRYFLKKKDEPSAAPSSRHTS
jgi:uncharacterized membrane protein YfcA